MCYTQNYRQYYISSLEFPHFQVSGGFLVGHMRGDNLNPIYHLGLGASHASFILPPIFLGSPNFKISFLTVFGYEVS